MRARVRIFACVQSANLIAKTLFEVSCMYETGFKVYLIYTFILCLILCPILHHYTNTHYH